MEESIIQIIHKWCANIMLIIFMHTTIIWFLFSDDHKRIKNNFFYVLLRLEFIMAIGLFFAGIILLILEPAWLDGKDVIVKIILGYITIRLIHMSNIKTRKYIDSGSGNDRKIINVVRVFTILFLMTVYTFGSMISTRIQYGHNIQYDIEAYQHDED